MAVSLKENNCFFVTDQTPRPGANPTIASYNASVVNFYNASVVNFYNATGSLARFENKNILFYFEKRCRLLQRWRCSCKL
jgi:hypothetical protein